MGNDIQQKHAEAMANQAVAAAASTVPMPGALRDTLPEASVPCKQFTVRPMKASDWSILQRIGSPIVRQAMQAMKPESERKDIEVQFEDMIAACYVFTRDSRVAWEDVRVGGKERLLDRAMREIGDFADIELLTEMFAAAQGKAVKVFNTHVQFDAQDTSGEKAGKPVFFQDSSQSP